MENNNTGFRAKIQKFGGVLSGMVMPNIGAFITWGLITAIFLQTGWHPNAHIAKLISPMLSYLLPILIGYTGGKNFYGDRGGVIGAAATMGVIVGADIPMFMGAMIMGPVAALCMKQVDKLFEGKIKPGFEMIVNNFSMGILGIFLVLAAYYAIGPFVQAINVVLSGGVSWIIAHKLIPFASIFIEPAKVLFLNNAINHGILSPIGITQAAKAGKSILFILEPNPGPGVGVLLAYTFFGTGTAKRTVPGVAIIHAFGGIHEPYFPFILMKPQMIIASICGAVSGNFVFEFFNCGLVATASPGSYFSVLAVAPKSDYLPIIAGMLLSTAVSFAVGSIILKAQAEGNKAEERRLKMAERMKEIYDQQRGLGIDRKTAMRRARGMAGLEDMVERRKDRKEGSGPIADSLAQVGGGGRSMMGSMPQLTEASKQTNLLQQIVKNTGAGRRGTLKTAAVLGY